MYTTVILASVMSLRVLGLFMILPLFSLSVSEEYLHTSPRLIGMAVGVYGLMQGLLQIPVGFMSDYFGRKKIIILGLILFILGNLLAIFSTTIQGLILARFLQGCGAIGCVVLASVADHTSEKNRIQAMAIVGITMGLSFIIAMILGPLLYSYVKLKGIFIFTVILSILAIFLVNLIDFKKDQQINYFKNYNSGSVVNLFKNIFSGKLLYIYIAIFSIHLLLANIFILLPIRLTNIFADHVYSLNNITEQVFNSKYYSFVLIVIFLTIIVLKYLKRQSISVVNVLIVGMAISLIAISFLDSSYGIFAGLLLFFLSFNILEATLPALVAKYSIANRKGLTMGIFSSCQFLGIFVGSSIAGYLISKI